MNIQNKKIAVTGLGLMTGLGLDLSSSWEGLLAGKCSVKRFSLFDPEGLPTPFGIELPEGADELFKSVAKTRNRRQMTRGIMISLATVNMALKDAGLIDDLPDRARIGAVIGCTGTGYAPTTLDTDPNRILKNMGSASAAWISLKWKLEGPAFTVSTACSSGAYAISSAMLLILSGQCDIVITGAYDSVVSHPDIEGFCSLLALSDDTENMTTASRPFDKNRSGFVMGEGSGMLILESMDHAIKRNARIYATTGMPGLTSEAYNILSPQPGGIGMARTMKQALDNAKLSPEDISCINAHGTSTQLNDLYETEAIKEVFGDHAYSVPVSGTKSMTGHCLSGAAGVESVIACKSLVENIIPPTMNLTDSDPELDLDYVPLKPRQKELHHVMSNSFAFGGHNGVCIFSKVR
jgi:3-oxoacyl-[acyl-carrier-protein] synthase II